MLGGAHSALREAVVEATNMKNISQSGASRGAFLILSTLALLMTTTCFGIGCGGEDQPMQSSVFVLPGLPAEASTTDGVTIAKFAGRVVGSFRENGHHVFFEAIDAGPRPAEFISVGGESLEQIDSRFIDADGHPFVVEAGGHDLADASWRTDSREATLIDEAARARDFVLVEHAVRQLALRDDRDAPIDAIVNLGTFVASDAKSARRDDRPGLVHTAGASLCTGYRHDATIRWANCCWSWGQHSALLVRSYSGGGALAGVWSSSNHGRSATDPSMTDACTWSSPSGRANLQPPMYSYPSDTFFGAPGGGCPTAYGLLGSQHVCNDDTLAELLNVKSNGLGTWSTCADGVLRASRPGCY